MISKRFIIGLWLIVLSFGVGCQRDVQTAQVPIPVVFQEPQDPGPAPKEYQPGYDRLFTEWCKKYFAANPKEEPDVLPEFEPDLSKKGEFFEGIYLDSGIPDSMYRALAKDLHSIRTLTFSDPDGELKRILKISDVNGETLLAWLQGRIKFVLGGEYQKMQERLELDEEEAKKLPELGTRYMRNLSTDFFENHSLRYSGDFQRDQRLFQIPGLSKHIEIRTPKTGVVELGTELVNPDIISRPQSQSRFRIAVLFHEARHSDGNRNSGTLGFNHVKCPEDYPLGNCDQFINGAYAVGALILKSLALECNTCFDKAKLLEDAQSYRSRVLSTATWGDDTPDSIDNIL